MEEKLNWLTHHPTGLGVPGSKPAVATTRGSYSYSFHSKGFKYASISFPGMNAWLHLNSVPQSPTVAQ